MSSTATGSIRWKTIPKAEARSFNNTVELAIAFFRYSTPSEDEDEDKEG